VEQTDAQLAAIVRSSGEAMVSMTPDLVITTWNAAAERLFGYSAAEVTGRETMMIPDELRGRFDEILKLVRAGSDQSYETRRRRKDGTLLDIAVTLSAIRDSSGALTGYCTVSRDITERLRGEAKLAAARAERDVRADRDRIAGDLRDRVIQRVYAAGLTLTADGDLTLLATDNGVGLGVPGRRSGLLNMRWRAGTLGGTFSAGTASGGGTRVEWRIPAGS
jgi:PAS domain S-box-containing protein